MKIAAPSSGVSVISVSSLSPITSGGGPVCDLARAVRVAVAVGEGAMTTGVAVRAGTLVGVALGWRTTSVGLATLVTEVAVEVGTRAGTVALGTGVGLAITGNGVAVRVGTFALGVAGAVDVTTIGVRVAVGVLTIVVGVGATVTGVGVGRLIPSLSHAERSTIAPSA